MHTLRCSKKQKKTRSLSGVENCVLQWMQILLNKQRAKFKNSMSDSGYVEHGIPQGTVLGPVLLLLYTRKCKSVV